jgi:NAD(P)H-hydrate epimerase
MPREPVVTREIAPLPERDEEAHKGSVGRIAVIGGCATDVSLMVGAAVLAAKAALRSGAGLVQIFLPEPLRQAAAMMAPCATTHTLPTTVSALLEAVARFHADVAAVGPGLGGSLQAAVVVEFLNRFDGPVVLDADGLNLLATVTDAALSAPRRIVMTPHPGEAQRLLAAKGVELPATGNAAARRKAACALAEHYGCTTVLKGHRTVVTDGERLYVNETGNAGMATGGAGDVLTGIIAALMGQQMPPLEAAILGVYLHGLAGDFAAEELGRWSVTASDLIDYLPEAFCEHEVAQAE